MLSALHVLNWHVQVSTQPSASRFASFLTHCLFKLEFLISLFFFHFFSFSYSSFSFFFFPHSHTFSPSHIHIHTLPHTYLHGISHIPVLFPLSSPASLCPSSSLFGSLCILEIYFMIISLETCSEHPASTTPQAESSSLCY